jgi:serine protease
MVVAVLDTGIRRDHVDLSPNLLPGYDFVNDPDTANDNSPRDVDPSDPGDWITSAENASGPFKDCGVEDSSWHGTKVSGIIGAATNNGIGMAGVAHGARILPLRVLGKCGGFDSDIQAAMRWAAGLSVPGVPANPTPARVLNLSLGSDGSCSQSYRDTIAQVNAAGAVVVAAAGNSTGRAVGTPANCPGAIGVAGIRHAGTKVGFSDLGPEIAIAAPGGNCVNITAGSACLYPILTSTNAGTREPLAGSSIYSDAYTITVGTSFAAPIVSGTVALMLATQPGLTPTEIKNLLQATARAFPTSGADNGPNDSTPVNFCQPPGNTDQLQCYCTTALCGAGMLDAAAATSAAAQALLARIATTPAAPEAGTAVILSGSGTLLGPGRSVASWTWSIVDSGGIVGGFSSATNAATASLLPTAAGTFTVRLTVTDDLGRSSAADASIAVAAAPVVQPPPPAQGGSSGGGAMGAGWLMALVLAAVALRRAARH